MPPPSSPRRIALTGRRSGRAPAAAPIPPRPSLLAVLALFVGCLAASPAAADLAEIRASGSLRACIAVIHADLTGPPEEGCEDCDWTGLVPDQVRLFASSLGVRAEFARVDWSEQFEDARGRVVPAAGHTPALLESGACDLYVSNLTRLEWRERLIDIVPVFENRMIVLTRPDLAERISGPADLAGLRVAVERHSSFHGWIEQLNEGPLAEDPIRLVHDGATGSLRRLVSGDADFAVTDADMAVMTIRNRHPQLVVAFAAGPVQSLGWGVSKQCPDLRAATERFLEDQTGDATSPLNALWRHHLGLSVPEFERLVRALPAP